MERKLIATESENGYDPNDYIFPKVQAMRFVKRFTQRSFTDWTRKYRVRRITRASGALYLRKDLVEALEHEAKELGERL